VAKSSEHKNSEHPDPDQGVPPADRNGAGGRMGRQVPQVVAPTNRVNVAFPFSQIKLQEASKELAELASLFFDLVVAMAEWVPEDQLEELRTRAKAVRDALR
jgi:hypothetical protein